MKNTQRQYQMDFSPELRDEVRKWANRFVDFDAKSEQFWQSVCDLEKEFGYLPSVNDAVWRVLNEERLESFYQGKVGLYLNATWGMSCLAASEQKYSVLLDLTAEHMILEFLGASNGNGTGLTKASFDRRFSAINKNRITNLELSAKQMSLDQHDVKQRFMRSGGRVFSQVSEVAPNASLEEIWARISAEANWQATASKPVRLRKTQPVLSRT